MDLSVKLNSVLEMFIKKILMNGFGHIIDGNKSIS